MSKYIITQNVADCIGCRACEVHCKEKNNPGTGAFFCRILEVASPATGSVPGIDFIYLGCFHCEKPWCVDACPTGAMRRRDQDGIVYVFEKDCVGCKACITACFSCAFIRPCISATFSSGNATFSSSQVASAAWASSTSDSSISVQTQYACRPSSTQAFFTR